MNTPLVSICCITYNHAQFIRKCLDGFLMQKTDFPIEILIHDDCSTDGTTEIVREYEAKYPDLIFPLYEEENQYQQGKAAEIDFYNYRRARGKYIAYCEGDDYWTDPLKLQKQVDFMEANPEYSVCFHNYVTYNTWNQVYTSENTIYETDMDVSLDLFLNGKTGIGLPLTMLFRVSAYDLNWYKRYTRYCDMMEIMHLLCVGNGRCLSFVGGQYNLHSGGVSSTNPDLRRSLEYCEDVKEMWRTIKHPAVKRFYVEAYRWRLDLCFRDKLYAEVNKALMSALSNDFYIGFSLLLYAFKKILKTINVAIRN